MLDVKNTMCSLDFLGRCFCTGLCIVHFKIINLKFDSISSTKTDSVTCYQKKQCLKYM